MPDGFMMPRRGLRWKDVFDTPWLLSAAPGIIEHFVVAWLMAGATAVHGHDEDFDGDLEGGRQCQSPGPRSCCECAGAEQPTPSPAAPWQPGQRTACMPAAVMPLRR